MVSAYKHILLIDNPGAVIATVGRELVVRGREIELMIIPKDVRVIIVDAYGGAVTTPAANVAAARNVEILIASRSHGSMALFAPAALIDARRATLKLRELQFRAAFSPRKTTGIAKAIVGKKVKAERRQWEIERSLLDELKKTRTTDGVRHVEARSAQLWWRQWAGFKMLFVGAAVPADWHSWPASAGKATSCIASIVSLFDPGRFECEN